MAKDYDIKDIQDALDHRRRQATDSTGATIDQLQRKVQMLQAELDWTRNHNKSLHGSLNHTQKRLQEEMQQHNDLYRALEERKKFDDWLKEAYPEAIEQYKAVMKLVEFMEDPPKPGATPGGRYQFGWGNPYDHLRQQWVMEAEVEKQKLEVEKQLKDAKTLSSNWKRYFKG